MEMAVRTVSGSTECVLEQHKSVGMGLKLKFCYEIMNAFVNKILILGHLYLPKI